LSESEQYPPTKEYFQIFLCHLEQEVLAKKVYQLRFTQKKSMNIACGTSQFEAIVDIQDHQIFALGQKVKSCVHELNNGLI
jgi:hypothetical protein